MESSRKTHPTFAQSEIDQAIEFAKQEFRLGSIHDPNSQRSHLLSVQKQTGRVPKELEQLVELPEACELAWVWFTDLHNSRTDGFNGFNPIAFTEIKAYFDLKKIDPTDREVTLIKRFDVVFLQHQQSKQKAQ